MGSIGNFIKGFLLYVISNLLIESIRTANKSYNGNDLCACLDLDLRKGNNCAGR